MKIFEKKNVVKIDGEDIKDARLSSAGFDDDSIKKRAYMNVLGARLAMKMLFSQKIQANNLYSLYTIHSVLEELNISDVYYNGIRMDVRLVFDKDQIFVPKSHFEYGLTPDVYLVMKLKENQTGADFLGFFEPKDIEKENENTNYYFLESEKLQKPEILKSFLENFTAEQDSGEEGNEEAEALFLSFVDKEILDKDKSFLLKRLASSIALREKIVEFENFEIISKKVAQADELLQDGLLEIVGTQKLFEDEEKPTSKAEIKAEVIGEVLSDLLGEEQEKFEDSLITGEALAAGGLAVAAGLGLGAEAIKATSQAAAAGAEIQAGLITAGADVLASGIDLGNKLVENAFESTSEPMDESNLLNEIDDFLNQDESLSELDEFENLGEIGAETEEEDFDIDSLDLDSFENIEDISKTDELESLSEIENEITEETLDLDSLDLDSFEIEQTENITEIDELENLSDETETSNDNIEPIESEIENDNFELESFSTELEDFEEVTGEIEEMTTGTEEDATEASEFENLEDITSEITELPELDEIAPLEDLENIEEITEDSEPESIENITSEGSEEILETFEENEESLPTLEQEPETEENVFNLEDFDFDMLNENDEPKESDIESVSLDSVEEKVEETTFSDPPEIDAVQQFQQLEEQEETINIEQNQQTSSDDFMSEVDNFLNDVELSDEQKSLLENELTSGINFDETITVPVITKSETIPDELFMDTDALFAQAEGGIQDDKDPLKVLFKESENEVKPEGINFDIKRIPSADLLKNKKVMVAASVAGVIMVSLAVGGVVMHNKNAATNLSDKTAVTAPGEVPEDLSSQTGAPEDMTMDLNAPAADQAMPSQSQEIPGEKQPKADVNRDMGKAVSDAFLSEPVNANITKIAWEVPEDLAYNDSFRKYLQMAGKNLKLNLQNDLLLATEMAYSNKVVVDLEIAGNGNLNASNVVVSSGSKQIDKIVLQSIKDTLKYLKVPTSELGGKSVIATLIINF